MDYTADDVSHGIDRKHLIQSIKSKGIDIKNVSIRRKEYNEDYHKFNLLIDRMKEEQEVELWEVALYLFQDYFDSAADVLNCFDENNRWGLTEEMRVRYHKGSLKNSLGNFLYF